MNLTNDGNFLGLLGFLGFLSSQNSEQNPISILLPIESKLGQESEARGVLC